MPRPDPRMRAASHSKWLGWTSATLCLLHGFVFIPAGSASLIQRATTLPSPISFPPAQNWDGPDGDWSTFTLRVGTPAQNVRVLISTASQSTWVVIPEGCGESDTSCQTDRGATFDYNVSSTWAQQGYDSLSYVQTLGLDGEGLWGNDTLGLGVQGSGGPTLNNQAIAGIKSNDIYLGMFGVNPKPIKNTGLGTLQDSYMASLKKQNLIPSITFGYTAGARYRLKKVLGSLTLGGYDQSRFAPNTHSFPLAPDDDRDLRVGVQSIGFTNQNGTTDSLLPEGIIAYVDSTVPYIYLPLEACKAFEKAFNLEYDATMELYPVSSSLHADLMSQNASITFALGDDINGGETINITLPYDSFDLTAVSPVVDDSTLFFPLKRAVNETQYILGRTFLQEAYLIVDYERKNFSISQCTFQDGSAQKLVSIPPLATANSTLLGSEDSPSSPNMTIIGIAVGVSVLAMIIVACGVSFFLIKRRRARRREEEAKANAEKADEENAERINHRLDKVELGTAGHARYEMGGSDVLRSQGEAGVPPLIKEKAEFFDHHAEKHELVAGKVDFAELPDQKRPVYEMYDSSAAPVELPADMPGELPTAFPSRRSSRRTPPQQSDAVSPFNDPTGQPSASSPRSPRSLDQPSPITHPTRSSTLNSRPFVPSSPSRSGPSSPTDRSTQSYPRSEGICSPISPIINSEGGPSPTEGRPSPSSTPSPGGSSWGRRSPHIAAMRSEDSRRRERRRKD